MKKGEFQIFPGLRKGEDCIMMEPLEDSLVAVQIEGDVSSADLLSLSTAWFQQLHADLLSELAKSYLNRGLTDPLVFVLYNDPGARMQYVVVISKIRPGKAVDDGGFRDRLLIQMLDPVRMAQDSESFRKYYESRREPAPLIRRSQYPHGPVLQSLGPGYFLIFPKATWVEKESRYLH
jgi:hypothetical protein